VSVSTYPADWHGRLPGFPACSGALLFNAADELLMVKPTYKSWWEIPGGIMEAGESPIEACVRELREELGLDLVPGRLLCVDWVPPERDLRPMIAFIFDGGVVSEDLRCVDEELEGLAFVPLAEIPDRASPRLARRVAGALVGRATGTAPYLDHGHPRH
jgi:8-oxo-dGTP diphosphatase